MTLLSDAEGWFKARETRIERRYSDDQGQIGFRVTVDQQPFLVVAKSYLKDGQASFMTDKVVERANDMGAFLLLFTKEQRLVFDPRTVLARGDHGTAERQDRQQRGERWTDIDADLSVDFQTWYDRRLMPPTPQETNPTSLDDYSPPDHD